MVIAPEDFRDEEYKIPREIFEKEGFQITVAASRLGSATGSLGMRAPIDTTLSQAKVSDYDAVVFVGGKGSWDYFDNQQAHRIAQEAAGFEGFLCAICSAPGILAKAGVLQGKKVTSFARETALLKERGASFTGKPVEKDGKLITADGPRSAEAFARSIVEAIKTGEKIGSRPKT